jgi:formamidopyrimidine-DNA glycosylase
MPELPDVVVYIEALERRIVGQVLEDVRLAGPSLLKTARPPLASLKGRKVERLRRIGKRIAIGLEGDLWLVLHLMIAGRLHWRERGAKLVRRQGLAAFDFPHGSLVLTEFGPKKRASLHLVAGEGGLAEHDPGGLEPLSCDLAAFRAALTRESHTLKRALTDPRLFSGIGNAYSDEILHAARLSPLAMTRRLGVVAKEVVLGESAERRFAGEG